MPSLMARVSGGSTNGKAATSSGVDTTPTEIICSSTDASEVRRISGSVKSGPGLEVVLGVQADRDAVREAARAAGALIGARLADRLDGQPLHLGRLGVAADAGGAGVHHVVDAGHGERGLGDVGGQHDAAAASAGRTRGAARRRSGGVYSGSSSTP